MSSGAPTVPNDYKYNGKEYVDDLGLNMLDYGARLYDPLTARWNGVDPLADHPNQVDKSPYAYAWNNPVKLTDPDGQCPICPFLAKGLTGLAVDYALQGVFNYISGMSITDAFSPSNIDKTDVLLSGITGMNPFSTPGGKYGAAAIVALGDIGKNYASALMEGEDYTTEQMAQDFLIGFAAQLSAEKVVELFGSKIVNLRKNSNTPEPVVAAKGVPWQKISGIVRDAAKGKGNFGLGTGTLDEAMTAGKSWVGDGYRIASDGKSLVSADELRIFRPPSYKPKLGKTQANFEWKTVKGGQPQGNGHLDIISP